MTDSKSNKAKEIPKAYDSNAEMEMYELWEKSGYFTPENIKSKKKPFVMTLPPPNANGKQHVGHMCGYSFQDCMGRFHRMRGEPTLLLAGKDHAGIQTEAVFTRVLEEQGKDKWKMGRKKFYDACYKFCIESADFAREQEKRIGLSTDWTREKFTLDPKLNEVIFETFYKMFDEGLVYRGEYIINQCTHCRTALANVDTEHEQKKGIFAYIKYPVVGKKGEFVTVATTRPETMLGDTAVAVNPKDKRYKKLVGKMLELPLTGREIPIIADRSVDPEVGTGALKVTPAHSSIDFEIGREHKLEVVNVIDESGKMTDQAPKKYQGMTTKEACDAVLNDLDVQGLLQKVENISHEVIVCERCRTAIEQIISKQWFVNVEGLSKKAIKAVEKGETQMVPSFFNKVMINWLKEIRPWCVSRQLWWGHRIPVWYCGGKKLYDWLLDNPGKTAKDYAKETGKLVDGCGQVTTGSERPEKCSGCGNIDLEPEEDCFDTWFSSGQWPFSTLEGPGGEDFKKYYPTDVMETMHDIIFFWVARMMMLGIYRTGKTPFHTVYYHGMILAPDGRKMSKSKGNVVEPTEVFEKYGADALRLWYFTDALPGKNTPIRDEKLQGNRNYVNKIWNASRFIMMQVGDLTGAEVKQLDGVVSERIAGMASSDDEWDKATMEAAKDVTRHLEKYKFNLATETNHEFFWHTLCDKWIEETKGLVTEEPKKKVEYLGRLIAILATLMKLNHPFSPFVTERIWQELKGLGLLSKEEDLLMVAKWPIES